ncbi:MAG: cysteine hydrolase family protein [Candidatus Melainabacteria bacterium]|nr:cysteine hydrolase family protein [Candidatus Melainabacteria bacterium]
MSQKASTLLDMLHMSPSPTPLAQSALVIVDAQREYLDGSLPLHEIDKALVELKELLARARKLNVPVFHVVHHAPKGAPIFNPDSEFSHIIDSVKPTDNEIVIVKHSPSSFVGTDLELLLKEQKKNNLVIGGFMTHMCINATTRSAADLGFAPTVVASTCTTRDLPALDGQVLKAADVHKSNLAALADLVACVIPSIKELPD